MAYARHLVAHEQASSGRFAEDLKPDDLYSSLLAQFGSKHLKVRFGPEHEVLRKQGKIRIVHSLAIINEDPFGHEPVTVQIVSNGSIDDMVEFRPPNTFNTSVLKFDHLYDTFVEKVWDKQFKSGELHAFMVSYVINIKRTITESLLMKLIRADVVRKIDGVGHTHIYALTKGTLDDYRTRHSETAALHGLPA